ncbi:glycoside hydrolase family 43 protein [Robinsoniella peoriensis]|uniref:glycoside hydrolase family 43 protein n=1 Tax=Robinsoniella peoriensis TaxID=180332 RepID=UPI003637E55C
MKLWQADNQDGTYTNPVLHTDYSDPDVICVGEDFYMISSSFTYVPGVPLLHSKDLVNWECINYCVRELPLERYRQPAHGCGTWAPAIRYYSGVFYAFIPLPDEGIFVTRAIDPYGEWSTLTCIKEAKGWIDPCPFWDENGKAYMIHAYAHSRCGIKHKLSISEMKPDATELIGEDILVYDGTQDNPTVEGPKLYSKDGWYYIFAPAGGVATGWQLVLRSRNIFGPYESKKVLHQGDSRINGPHQGAWVTAADGRDWFVHFQDAGIYGRIVHLQPLRWANGWPVIGIDSNNDGIGEPVLTYEMPVKKYNGCPYYISAQDDFHSRELGFQWQWQANPSEKWYSLTERPGYLRLYAMRNEVGRENLLWYLPNLLTQMLQRPDFHVKAELFISGLQTGDMAGIGILGHCYNSLNVKRVEIGFEIGILEGEVLEIQGTGIAKERIQTLECIQTDILTVLLDFTNQGTYQFAYQSAAGERKFCSQVFTAQVSTWTGAKLMLFCLNRENRQSSGYLDVKSFTVNPL